MTDTTERKYAIEGRKDAEAERIAFNVDNMRENKAYRYAAAAEGGDPGDEILEAFQDRFRAYRKNWRGQPQAAIERQLTGAAFAESGMYPLSVDIEIAAICDLACPFCFRQYIVTPDKIISEDLYYRVIDQCAEMGVPSIKLNWRGEPLLHPKIHEFIDYAKCNGVLEVMINTNATTLDEKKARQLIEAGLDQIIYSFDGGSAASYEAMRVGRFKPNSFADVYQNIRRFSEIRREMGAVYPRTKIQMILTEATFDEQDQFFELFEDCVDDVSVKAYTERGGSLPDLDEATRTRIEPQLAQHGVDHQASFWRDIHGDIFISTGRLPCEQPFQRLMVTYDGRVSMCCYDWGSEHPIGYLDEMGFDDSEAYLKQVVDAVAEGKAGFAEFMAEARMPTQHIHPPKVVESLSEIWAGATVDAARKQHVCGDIEEIEICTQCPFKETYTWLDVNEGSQAAE
tara:strand:- start:334 stop:1698 length:1365 start_codon:yes stop_codon:yes gene_type:complete